MSRIALRHVVFSTTLIATLLTGFAPRAAAASILGTATGTFAVTSEHHTEIGRQGGDIYYAETLTIAYAGDLSGTTTNTDVYVLHSDGTETTQLGSERCDACTLDGRTGSYTAVWDFVGSATQGTATVIFTRGLGGLTGLVGGGDAPFNSTSATYSFTYYLP